MIHSFTTVMNETGANIGYIIAKSGFQKGAYDYIENTNIRILSFEEFQIKYSNKWGTVYCSDIIERASDSLVQYCSPISSRRQKHLDNLPLEARLEFYQLCETYIGFSAVLLSVSAKHFKMFSSQFRGVVQTNNLRDLNELKQLLRNTCRVAFAAQCYADLLIELQETIRTITNKFNKIFGKDIYKG